MPETRVIPVDPDRPDPGAIAEAALVIQAGGLVAFPTETVYGLGADATNPDAVARIFEAKGRPSTNPLIVHVKDKRGALACVADWPESAETLADRFWPGPLTLVLPRSAIIPDIVAAGGSSVGVRVPGPLVARLLIHQSGRPIAAPSANRSTGISATSAAHVFKDLGGRVDLILDAGPTSVGIESTVVSLLGPDPVLLRPGDITPDQIASVLGRPVFEAGAADGPALSPGRMAIHYAPKTPAYRVDRDRPLTLPGGRFAVLVLGDSLGDLALGGAPLLILDSPEVAARELYAHLHRLDELGLDLLLVVPPPDEARWRAIRDRIARATRPWPDSV